MTIISHYVVVFDHETGKFDIDWETTNTLGGHGIFDTVSGEWKYEAEVSERDAELNRTAGEVIENACEYILSVDVEEE